MAGGKNKTCYVDSFSVRGGTETFKDYVLDQSGYVDSHGKPVGENDEFYKIKSRRRFFPAKTFFAAQNSVEVMRRLSGLNSPAR